MARRRRARTGSRGARRPQLFFIVVSAVAALALVGFIVGVVVSRSSPRPPTLPRTRPHALAVGTRAPTFTLARLGGGTPVTLATAQGHPVILNFFASWCANCKHELAAVAAASRAGAGRVAVIGVDTSDTSASVPEQLLAAAGASFPVGVDPTGSLATRYDITGLPVTFYLTAGGRIAGVAFGAQTEASLLHWEHRLLAAR